MVLHKFIKPFDTYKLGLCDIPGCTMRKMGRNSYLVGQTARRSDEYFCPDCKEIGNHTILSVCVKCIIHFEDNRALTEAYPDLNNNAIFIYSLYFTARLSAAQPRRALQKEEQLSVAEQAQEEILNKITTRQLTPELCEAEIAAKHNFVEALKTSILQLDNALWAGMNPTSLSEWRRICQKYKTECPHEMLQRLKTDFAKGLRLIESWEADRFAWIASKLDNCVLKWSREGCTEDNKPKVKELRKEKSFDEMNEEQVAKKRDDKELRIARSEEGRDDDENPETEAFECPIEYHPCEVARLFVQLVKEAADTEEETRRIARYFTLDREHPNASHNQICGILAKELGQSVTAPIKFFGKILLRALHLARQDQELWSSLTACFGDHNCENPDCEYRGPFPLGICPLCGCRRPNR